MLKVQQDATIYSLFISANCSTCFGWYIHPSSGANVTVSTAPGISKTVTATCRERDLTGTAAPGQLLMPGAVDTLTLVPDDGWRYHPKLVERFTDINKQYIVASCLTIIGIYFTKHGPFNVKNKSLCYMNCGEKTNVQMSITPVSYPDDTMFKSRSGDSSFPEFLGVKSGILPQIRPRPLHIILIPVHSLTVDRSSTVVEALCYKSEGRWFDSRWCQCNFSLTYSFRPHYGPGVDSASNRNEYQEYFSGGKGGRCVRLTT